MRGSGQLGYMVDMIVGTVQASSANIVALTMTIIILKQDEGGGV